MKDILDQGFVCHLGFIADGHPAVLPMMYTRLDDAVFIHGSPRGGPILNAKPDGLDVCLAVTLVDGIVLARSAFNHSLNYRSVIVHGLAHTVKDTILKRNAFNTLIEHVAPGRTADTRPMTERELATAVMLRLDLREATAKIRTGGPKDIPEDLALPFWAGVIPITPTTGKPIPAKGLPADITLPDYLTRPHTNSRPLATA